MPRGDRTGPMGMGKMSGRAAGYCNGFGTAGYASGSPFIGGGFGRGNGTGYGWRRMACVAGMPGWRFRTGAGYQESNAYFVEEKSKLEQQVFLLEAQLQEMKDRLNQLREER